MMKRTAVFLGGLLCAIAVSLAAAGEPSEPYATPPRPDTPHREAQDAIVARAREGDAAALADMAQLREQHPGDQYVLGDYILLLQWSKSNAEALALLPELDLSLVHAYVADAVFRAYCVTGDHYGAQRFAENVVRAQRGNPELMVSLAISIASAGDMPLALSWLEKAGAEKVGGIGNRVAEARQRIGAEPIEAVGNLARVNRAVGENPEDIEARHQFIAALEAVNARVLARDEMLRLPADARDSNDAKKLRELHYAAARSVSSWGEEYTVPAGLDTRTRFFVKSMRELDHILAEADGSEPPEFINRVEAAKIKLFYEMNMLPECRDAYFALLEKGWRIPTAALLSAAGAFMGLRRPAQAKELYMRVYARQCDAPPVQTVAELDNTVPEEDRPLTIAELHEAKNGLFWSLLENEELPPSLAQAWAHYQEGVRPDDPPKALYQDIDWRKMDVTLNRSHASLYTNFLRDAEAELMKLTDDAPADVMSQTALATAQSMRGLPRTAAKTLKRARNHGPGDIGIATRLAEEYLTFQNWREAHDLVRTVRPYAAKVASAKELQRSWEIHNMYELRWDVSLSKVTDGVSPNAGSGSAPTVEVRLFSRPIKYNWRVFAGAGTSAGDFEEGHARQTTYFGGVEYRDPWVTATLEARADKVRETDFALALSGEITPDDHWRIPFNFELLSRDTPLRARLDGVTANAAAAGVSYYWNEIKSFNSMFSFMDFSDGNRRASVSADFTHRLLTCFNHTLDGQIYTAASRNSEDAERVYFNPETDFEAGLRLTYGNLLWRHYDKSLRHTITAGAGNYWQKNYGSDIVYGLGYSQSWEWGKRFSVSYGVGYDRRVYDGDPEGAVTAWLSGSYRF